MSVRSFYCIDFNFNLSIFLTRVVLWKDKWLLAIRQTTDNDNSTSLFLALLHRFWMSCSNFKVFHRIAIIRPVLVMPLWDNSFITCHCFGSLQDERFRSRCMSLWYNRCVETSAGLNEKATLIYWAIFSSPSCPLLLLYPKGSFKPFSNHSCLSLGPLWMWALFSVSIVWTDLSLLLHLPSFWSVWYAYLFTEAWVLTENSALDMDEGLEFRRERGIGKNG